MTTGLQIPGTVQLVDVDGSLRVEHGGSTDIVLVPQPTDDPDDPLRWRRPRKLVSIIIAMAWCFLIAALISGLSPAYLLIEKDTGISVADLSTGNGIMFLFLGWGCLITQAVALTFGRRVTFLVAAILSAAVSLWTAYISSRGEWFVNRILLGIAASPQETLIEVVIGDIFFTHDRGFYMGAYSFSLWGAAFICPVATGYVAQNLGWRWIQYIMTIFGVVAAVLTFFFFEETMFYRDHAETVGTAPGQQSELHSDTKMHAPAASSLAEESGLDAIGPSTKTYTQKLKLWGLRDARQPSAFRVFFLPFRLLFMFPGMGFGGLLVGAVLASYTVVGGSLALILGNPPYNFDAMSIGLTYLASVIGVIIGCFVSGWLADVLAVFIARRKGGVMEPEQRLWIALLPLVLHPAGCLLYGVGASYHIHWAGVVVGLGLISVTLPIGSNLAFTYVLDSYKEVAGEGFVSVILIRNMMGFAFGYAVVPMITNLGLRYAFVVVAMVGWTIWCTPLLMIWCGKSLRTRTAAKYWRLCEAYGAEAH
ncbi:major facilitator superfamily domain-containing protein [Microdochium bolleyi]|uniref:Major facilitator superfamily domain-containing protein n=1 Tax=Microdochium bolleyi TaxID=196109 RepID=A0A136IXI1_9PEZI|nr:major facilitator superfamily domain-containing protein [Microdochium bolleyi]